jgi:hypothetical protein
MKDWVAYYDSDHSIYVNARHRDVHYARLADALAGYVPSRAAAVLDYGCGEALHADRVAAAAGWLTLAEAGPAVRARLIERFKANPKIVVVSTDQAASMLPQSFDMVILRAARRVGALRRVCTAAFWLAGRLFLCRCRGADTHRFVRLLAAASEGWADPLRRTGDGGQARGGRL